MSRYERLLHDSATRSIRFFGFDKRKQRTRN